MHMFAHSPVAPSKQVMAWNHKTNALLRRQPHPMGGMANLLASMASVGTRRLQICKGRICPSSDRARSGVIRLLICSLILGLFFGMFAHLFIHLFARLIVYLLTVSSSVNLCAHSFVRSFLLVMPCPCEDRTCLTGTCGRTYDVIMGTSLYRMEVSLQDRPGHGRHATILDSMDNLAHIFYRF